MANYRGYMEKFEGYDMGTMRTMEVNFGATTGRLSVMSRHFGTPSG